MKCSFIIALILLLTFLNGETFSQLEEPGYYEFIPPPQLDPTYANIASPENILVVYRLKRTPADTMSSHIAQYYKQVRNIPDDNVLGLEIPTTEEINGHTINVLFFDELIHDADWEVPQTDHAWQYVQNNIMIHIQNHLDTTFINGQPLRDIIRYIVLCKGIPLKVNAYVEYSGNNQNYKHMVAVDGLVCLLSQPNPNFSILTDIFGTFRTDLYNPYAYQDRNFAMDYRFVTNHFTTNNGIQLSYLVSRLDGQTYDDVITLIDNSLLASHSGNSAFVLDGHLSWGLGVSELRADVTATHNNLQSLAMIDTFDVTDMWITGYGGTVMGYSSSGAHAGMPLEYIVNLLNFSYEKGAVFNTYESYNGIILDIGNYNRRPDQGLISEFINMGGTGGVCHTYEPRVSTVVKDSIYFPTYAIGYSAVDAAYQGMPFLAYLKRSHW
jgi:uncharacterized protein (TIGR03790 family)